MTNMIETAWKVHYHDYPFCCPQLDDTIQQRNAHHRLQVLLNELLLLQLISSPLNRAFR